MKMHQTQGAHTMTKDSFLVFYLSLTVAHLNIGFKAKYLQRIRLITYGTRSILIISPNRPVIDLL